ncbi:MAG: hypothetical protein JNJ83_00580 [Verrucomicrobiaceae bacterium]|nr:hypothetical protein [Verrucomicrobiaceae bacterium]
MDQKTPIETFWDPSAILALLLLGPNTNAAETAWSTSDRAWMWKWTRLEVEAALSHRRAPPEAWTAWRRLQAAVQIVDLVPDEFSALCQFNRTAKLGASTASQLFVFDRTSAAVTSLKLVTFDRETLLGAEMLSLPLM